jgi:hypothetical protein
MQNTYLQHHQQQQHSQQQERKQNEPLTLKNTEPLQEDLEQAYVPLVPSLNIASTDHNPECKIEIGLFVSCCGSSWYLWFPPSYAQHSLVY